MNHSMLNTLSIEYKPNAQTNNIDVQKTNSIHKSHGKGSVFARSDDSDISTSLGYLATISDLDRSTIVPNISSNNFDLLRILEGGHRSCSRST